jgi:hypothetical protein
VCISVLAGQDAAFWKECAEYRSKTRVSQRTKMSAVAYREYAACCQFSGVERFRADLVSNLPVEAEFENGFPKA